MSNFTKVPKPIASFANQGNTKQYLLSHKLAADSWIVDTSASDHMIGSLDALSMAYEACDHDITISMANGVVPLIIGQG